MQILIVGAEGEVDVVAVIDGCSSLSDGVRNIGNLVDGCVVAHHHSVEADIVAKDLLEDLTVGHTSGTMHVVVARHDGDTARQSDHRLVGQQDFFHHLFLLCVATPAIAEVMLRTGTHTFLQVALLQALHEGSSHDG